MSRLKVPDFVTDVFKDPTQRGILIAGTLSILAVGLVPRVFSPGLVDAQQALKTQPQAENLLLLLTFVSAAVTILGGLVADFLRRRSVLVASLALMVGAAAVSVFITDGVIYYAATFIAVAASGVALAYAIGSVAVAYDGVPRATALGIVYAAFGAGSAAAMPLLTIFGPFGPRWQAYIVSAIAAAIALWAARRWMPHLPGALPAPKRLLSSMALWVISIFALTTGIIGLVGDRPRLLPLILIAGGAIGIIVALLYAKRSRARLDSLQLDLRPLGAAIAVGVTVGFAQMVPLMLMPVVFQFPLGYGALFSLLAIAPFAIALFIAGPVSGIMLRKYGPREVMASGTLFIGLGNIALAIILSRAELAGNYLWFILPLIFIGAGFVISTTVRTAIVFASTSRGLPGSAAALNQASVDMGSRLGIVVSTAVLAAVAMRTVTRLTEGLADSQQVVDRAQQMLVALGTPGLIEMIGEASIGQRAVTRMGYVDGVVAALVLSGVVAIGGAILAWVLIGKRDPIETVFAMRDERPKI
jgi:MFS family permease